MENMIILQLSKEELSKIITDSFRDVIEELKNKFEEQKIEEDLLTIREAAEFLNLTVPTIYSKVSKREIPFMKYSKKLYFSKKELREYIKN